MGLSLFLGLAFRANFSPEKITTLIRIASRNIDPRLNVNFERAYLSLSDGLFPELSVVVENLTADSEQACWMRPLMKVDQVRLPLALGELIRGRVALATVDVGHFDLLLRSEMGTCAAPATQSPAKAAVPAPSAASTTGSATSVQEDPNLDVKVTRRNPVENISIRSIRIQGPTSNWTPVDLRRVHIQNQAEAKILTSTGTMTIPVGTWAGSAPHADFIFVYQGLPEPHLEIKLNGNWREGRFLLDVATEIKSQKTTAILEAEHLPLTQILGLLKKQSVIERELNGRQAWLSLKAKTLQASVLGPETNVKIEDFKIEGDLGEVEAKEFQIMHMSPMEASPFTLALHGVRLEKLFSFLDLQNPSPILGDMGTFNGELTYRNSKDYELSGEHSGLQFIFSNRGGRELQTLSLVAGKAHFLNESWTVDLNQILPLDGLFLGHVKIKADQPWKHVDVETSMDELTLGPEVQKLMTGGGSLGRWNGELALSLEDGQVRRLNGKITVVDALIENLAIRKAAMDLSSKSGEVIVEINGQGLNLAEPSPLLETLKDFMPANSQDWKSDQLRLSVQSRSLENLSWRLAPVKVGPVVLASQGNWDGSGRLTGELTRTEKNQQQKWLIRGTRASPRMDPESRK